MSSTAHVSAAHVAASSWPATAIAVVVTLAFVSLAIYIIRTSSERNRAKVLTAAAALMAPLPAILLTLFGR